MGQRILPGFDRLEVIDEGESYRVLYGFHTFLEFEKDSVRGQRLAVALLVGMDVSVAEIQRQFGIYRSTLDFWVDVLRTRGLDALLDLRSGPEEKVTEPIRRYIIDLYKNLGGRRGWRLKVVEEVRRLFDVEVCFKTVGRVIADWKAEGAEQAAAAKALGESAAEADSETSTPQAAAPSEAPAPVVAPQHERVSPEPVASVVAAEEHTAPSETPAPKAAAARKQTASPPLPPPSVAATVRESRETVPEVQEQIVDHGGVLLALPALDAYDVDAMIPANTKSTNGYTNHEVVFSLLFLLMARLLKTEENIKLYDDPGMGGLIGRERLPSLRVVRDVMATMVDSIKDRLIDLKLDFARRCMALRNAMAVFYLDGHMMLYTGAIRLLKAYHTQRRRAEKGRVAYVVNTPCGRPFHEYLCDLFDHSRDNLKRIVDTLTGPLGVKRPLIVTDRGMFSEEAFADVEAKADLLCWAVAKKKPPGGATWVTVNAPVESNRWGVPKWAPVECTETVLSEGDETGIGHRRMLFIKRGEHVAEAMTSRKNATLEELALAVVRRWGAQENPFKELKEDGYDRIHSYMKEEFTEAYLEEEGLDPNRLMDNPVRVKLVEEKRRLVNKRDQKIGRRAQKDEKNPSKARARKSKKLEEIKARIAAIDKDLAVLPEKILRAKYIEEHKIGRLRNDKKKYFDLMNFVAFNARKDLAEIIGPVYENNRDIHQIVLKFLNMKATVRRTPGETIITFRAPSKPAERRALKHLCEHLTSLQKRSRLFPGLLVYRVT